MYQNVPVAGAKRRYEGWKWRVPEAEAAVLAVGDQDGMQALQALEGARLVRIDSATV